MSPFELFNIDSNIRTRQVFVEKHTIKNSIAYKWEQSGLLDGFLETHKENIAQLFESQASQLISEATQPIALRFNSEKFKQEYKKNFLIKIKSAIKSAIKSVIISLYKRFFKKEKKTISPYFNSIALPIARPIFARTLAQDLVSVQPLSLPAGLLFYMDSNTLYREDVFKRVVLVEKYKPLFTRYAGISKIKY